LDYDKFKSLGYPIGSGEIESAHKSIPQKRLKIPGASWNADSIDPMLALRILRANDWWERFLESTGSRINGRMMTTTGLIYTPGRVKKYFKHPKIAYAA
jgi:hypothetical protein